MSVLEIVVILSGLFLGYWVVSKFLTGKTSAPSPADRTRDRGEAGRADAPASWHEILGVSPDASMEEIRQAYRTLMSQYHPDKVASLGEDLKKLAEAKSREITRAYRAALRAHGANV
ncbi:MAG: J domain-containing protein [Candidatus Accumulibacter sp.]|jgi:DnaJ like chaperone protein|nr:J domain-containing protein [Accumulibacter sp.]